LRELREVIPGPFLKDLGVDLLAGAGHKGLLGPLGTGLLYIREGLESLLDSVRQGGTGSASFDDRQPLSLPNKYESGNPNALGLVGLGAGVDFLTQRGLASISQHESALTARLIDGLAEIPGVRIHGAPANDRRLGVVSITLADRSTTQVAAILDQEHNIQVRAGYHCAALVHRALGTIEREGTVRFSVGPFNSEQDIGTALKAVREIACGTTQTPQIPVKPPCVAATNLDEGASSKATAADVGVSVDQIPGMTELWSHTYGDPEIYIAILDGAVDLLHPSLIGKKDLVQKDILSRARSGDLQPTLHGTHIASVIFGQHDSPVRGIAPQCRGLIIPIYSDDGTQISCSKSDLATAIRAAVDEGAHVINISGGELLADGAASEDLRAAIQYCCAEKRRLIANCFSRN